jgi:hypothetical protein
MAAGVADGETSVQSWAIQVICRKCKSIKDVITGKYLLLYCCIAQQRGYVSDMWVHFFYEYEKFSIATTKRNSKLESTASLYLGGPRLKIWPGE